MTYKDFVDDDLEDILKNRLKNIHKRPIVVGTGITSSHLGDERNLREFVLADAIVKHLRIQRKNVTFLLFDDSYDPLDFRQLRVAVNKDEKLIKEFEKYCGMPIKLIPDPFDCHDSYSDHFQSKILDRFHDLEIFPNIIDSYASYDSGLYDFAKEIVFTKMEEIKEFLKKKFPSYNMKKIFWPLCPTCTKLDEAEIERIEEKKIFINCKRCDKKYETTWKKIKGKFSWKVDIAIKWNIFKSDFEPFSKAYLDPDVGSYFIAKSLSEEFFGGYYPEIVEYGQVFMDRELSYTLLPSLPREVFDLLFLNHRKKDIKLSKQKIIQVAKQYLVRKEMSYFDYIQILLPYENLEFLSSEISPFEKNQIMNYGNKFTKLILKKDIYPKLPTKKTMDVIDSKDLLQIHKSIDWVVSYKNSHPKGEFEVYLKHFKEFFEQHQLSRSHLFPLIRGMFSQEHTSPLSRVLYYIPDQFLYASIFLVERHLKESE